MAVFGLISSLFYSRVLSVGLLVVGGNSVFIHSSITCNPQRWVIGGDRGQGTVSFPFSSCYSPYVNLPGKLENVSGEGKGVATCSKIGDYLRIQPF